MNDGTTGLRWGRLPRLLRFFVVGGINTVFGYGAYALFVYVGFHYAWAALLGTIVGTIFNYFTTGGLVFDGARNGGFVRFVSVYAVVYFINIGALALLQQVRIGSLVVGPYLAGLLLIVPTALISYVLMRRFVFATDHGPD